MKHQIDTLVKLQAVQSEANAIRENLARVHEKIAAIQARRQEFEASLAETESRADTLKHRYRTLESDAKTIQAQIAKSQNKLHAVKTNKEYQSSLKEIEDLKTRHSRMEDEMLECLDGIDAAESDLTGRRREFEQYSRELDDSQKQIEGESAEGEKRLQGLVAREKAVAESVDPRLLEIFNSVRKKQARGLAVVPVTNAICLGCNVNLPPQMYNEMQKCDQLQFCPNCQRIVYWQPD